MNLFETTLDSFQIISVYISTMNNNNNKLKFIEKLYPLGFRSDAKELSKMTIMFTFAYLFSIWSISTILLAFTIYSLISNTIMIGIMYGSETLLPQCYGENGRCITT
ncbi:hypothetical protein I4U23_022537 [Adineta vaga]|nr:hypothetical protein I4U23_022537 [Adineta vaga]